MIDYAWSEMGKMFWLFVRIFSALIGGLMRRSQEWKKEGWNGESE